MKNKHSLLSGFTLVELLVVMGVIGTLAAGLVIVINPGGQLSKARDAERKSDLVQIQRALEVYYDDFNRYPDNLEELFTSSAVYIEQLPTDPKTDVNYTYTVDSPGNQIYRLYAHLESTKDPQMCNPEDPMENCYNAPENQCGDGEMSCNFGVSSPNTSP